MEKNLMHLRATFFTCVCLLFLCVACSKTTHKPTVERSFPVKVQTTNQQDVPIYLEAIGIVSSPQNVDIKPQVGGEIIEVGFKGGDDVEPGDLLYRIDPLPFQIALEKAYANLNKDRAALTFAHSKIERYKNLLKNNFVSKLSVEEYKRDVYSLEAQLAVDQAEVHTAQVNLNYTYIVAPIKGRMSLSKVDRGNVVLPNQENALTTILQIEPIYVDFSIPQVEFEKLQQHLLQNQYPFTVILPGTQQEFNGFVTSFNNQVDTRTGTIRLRGTVKNEEKILWPGEFVQVKVLLEVKKDKIVVPQTAVQLGANGYYVYVLQPDQTVKYQTVVLESKSGEKQFIKEGLKVGDVVVIDGQINLIDGAKVAVVKEKTA